MWLKPECTLTIVLERDPILMVLYSQLQSGTIVGEDGYNGMVDCFKKIIKNEGFLRLYRGISAPILMEAPKRYGWCVAIATK